MAVTKIWRVRGKVGNVIDYAKNPDKTVERLSEEELSDIADVLEYADDEVKTENHHYTTGINCDKENAREDFEQAKRHFGKQGGIVAIHGYQSFEEEEVTPDEAHAIGVALAKELWGNKFQVLVSTHLNTVHIHNHFIVNSVSFRDGKRFHMCTDRYLEMREASDRLCQEYNLSVIENPKVKGISHYLYKLEQAGMPTRYSVARAALDEAISRSLTIEELKCELRDMGYKFQFNPNRKYWTVTLPGWEKPIRLYKLGTEYTNERIMERIYQNDNSVRQEKIIQAYNKTVGRYNLPTRIHKIGKRPYFERMYLRCLYEMGYLPRYKQRPERVHKLFKDELLKCELYSKEARLIGRERISSIDELNAFEQNLQKSISEITAERDDLRKVLKRSISESERESTKDRVTQLTKELRILRSELNLCEDIRERSGVIEERLKTIDIERDGRDKNIERR